MLTREELATLGAAIRLFMPDDEGETDDAAGRAVDSLAELAADIPGIRAVISEGVAWLDEAAATDGRPAFAALPMTRQLEIVTARRSGHGSPAMLTFMGMTFVGLARRAAVSAWLGLPSVAARTGFPGPSALAGGNPDFAGPKGHGPARWPEPGPDMP